MRWHTITACLLLAAILLGGVLFSHHVSARCDQMSDLLSRSRDVVIQTGHDTDARLKEAEALWQNELPLLSALLIHDRIDQISQTFAEARGFLEAENFDEYLAVLGDLLFSLRMVGDYDALSLRNLL